jgi:hypothetical protein
MRTETTTKTVGGIMTPDTIVTRVVTLADNRAVISTQYTCEVTILGVDPSRGTTPEERSRGFVQIDLPITVVASSPEQLIATAKDAASTAVHFTEGQELTLPRLVFTEYLASRAVKKALREMDEDV